MRRGQAHQVANLQAAADKADKTCEPSPVKKCRQDLEKDGNAIVIARSCSWFSECFDYVKRLDYVENYIDFDDHCVCHCEQCHRRRGDNSTYERGLWHNRPLHALYVAWQWYLAVVGALLGCYRSLHALYVALQWLEAVLGCTRFAMVHGSGWRSFLAALVPLMLSMWLRSG